MSRFRWRGAARTVTGLAVLAVLVAAVAVGTGCAGHAPAAARVVLDSRSLRLPLDAYRLSAGEQVRVTDAEDRVVRVCMHRFGLTPPRRPDTAPLGPTTHTERRYGLTDPKLAARDGYHLGNRDPRTAPRRPTPHLSPAQELVLFGSAAGSARHEYAGRPVPEGGCLGAADRRVGVDDEAADLVDKLDAASVLDARHKPAVKAAFRDWSACMRADGFDYAMPWDPANDPRFTGRTSSPTEIRVATADVACKKKTNVVGVWYAADVALQRVSIDRHRYALRHVEANNRYQLAAAAAILAGQPAEAR